MVPRPARAPRVPLLQRALLDGRCRRRGPAHGRPVRRRASAANRQAGDRQWRRRRRHHLRSGGAASSRGCRSSSSIGIVLGVLGVVFGVRGRRTGAHRRFGRRTGVDRPRSVARRRWCCRSWASSSPCRSSTSCSDFMEPGPYEARWSSCTVGPGAIDVEAALTNRSDEPARLHGLRRRQSAERCARPRRDAHDGRARCHGAGHDAPHGAFREHRRVPGATGRARPDAVRSRHGSHR